MSERYYRMPWPVLALGLLLGFATWLPLLLVPPIEDVIEEELNTSHTLTGLLFSAPVAMLALVAIPGGFIADRIGIKKAVGIGAVILAAGSALRGVASDFPTLMGFTLVYGVGLGLSFPNLPKLARHCTPREKSNVTLGMFTSAILISGALSLVLARPVIYPATHSFQGVFLLGSLPAIAVAILWWIFMKDPPCESSGVQAVTLGLASLRKTITKADLWLVSVLFLLHNLAIYTILGWTPAFLKSIGAEATPAGLIASVVLWAGVVSVLVLTRLSTTLGKRKPFLWGSSIVLVFASYGVWLVDLSASWALMVVIGSAAAIRFAITLALPVEIAPPEHSGSASGLVMSVGYLGALAGPVISGFILDSTASFQWLFVAIAAVSAATAVVAFAVPETGNRAEA